MVHFTALVASSAALFSVAQAAPAAARHLRADANPPAGNAIAQAKRGLVASAEVVIGGHQHYTTTNKASKTRTKTRKVNKADKKTKHKSSKHKYTTRHPHDERRQSSTPSPRPTPSCTGSPSDSLLCLGINAKVGHALPLSGRSLPAQANKKVGGVNKPAAKPVRPVAAGKHPVVAVNNALLGGVLSTEVGLLSGVSNLLGGLGVVVRRQNGGRHAKADERPVIDLETEAEAKVGGKRKHVRRDASPSSELAVSGVPGFVQIATPLFDSPLARSIAGLVFTAPSTSSPQGATNSSSTFALATSSTQSTQFFLVPDADQAAHPGVVSIRLPLLDAQTFAPRDFCATFDSAGPSALSLAACGAGEGVSQAFGYNSSTGELTALYGKTGEAAPMAFVETSKGKAKAASADADASADAAAEAKTIKLYFVPAESLANSPGTVSQATKPHKAVSKRDDAATGTRTEAQVYAEAVAAIGAQDASLLSATVAAQATLSADLAAPSVSLEAAVNATLSVDGASTVTAPVAVETAPVAVGGEAAVQARRAKRTVRW